MGNEIEETFLDSGAVHPVGSDTGPGMARSEFRMIRS